MRWSHAAAGIAAIAIAALLGINISYLQEAIHGRVGISASLVDVTRVFASLGAAGTFALISGKRHGPRMFIAAAFPDFQNAR